MIVVLDLGGVLSDESDVCEVLAERVGVEPRELQAAYWERRRAFDEGLTDLEYWGAVLEPMGVDVDEELADELGYLDMVMWADIRPGAREVVARLVDAGRDVWVLSNAPTQLDRALADADWTGGLRGWVVSGLIGHAKPEPEIYAELERRAGVDPAEVLFVDDRAENVDAALARGWRAHLWRSDADTAAWLEEELGA